MKKQTGNILVVDDTPSAVLLLKELLVNEGYSVRSAFNAQTAMELIKEEIPDLLLLDIKMPEVNGFDLYKQIKQVTNNQQIPTIFVTAFTSSNYRQEGLQLGAIDFINKPIDKIELLLRINTHIKISLLQKQLFKTNGELNEKVKLYKNEIERRKETEEKLRESQKRYKLLSEATFEGIAVLQGKKIIDANHQFAEILGVPFNKIRNTEILNFIHCDDKFKFLNLLQNSKYETLECKGVRKKKEDIYLKINIRHLPSVSNEHHLLVIEDITEHKQIDDQIIRTIIETEEKERKNISQEIHDGLGPLLSTIKMYLEWINKPDAKTDKQQLIAKMHETIDEAIQTVHDISFNLSPHILNNFGFLTALKKFIIRITDLHPIKIDLTASLTERLKSTTEIILYRILTECINNTIKYAKASQINIEIFFEKSKLIIIFADNGLGFDSSQTFNDSNGLGISNMKSRIESINGSITFFTSPGKGITIRIEMNL